MNMEYRLAKVGDIEELVNINLDKGEGDERVIIRFEL